MLAGNGADTQDIPRPMWHVAPGRRGLTGQTPTRLPASLRSASAPGPPIASAWARW